jgi:hypothetical protein
VDEGKRPSPTPLAEYCTVDTHLRNHRKIAALLLMAVWLPLAGLAGCAEQESGRIHPSVDPERSRLADGYQTQTSGGAHAGPVVNSLSEDYNDPSTVGSILPTILALLVAGGVVIMVVQHHRTTRI